MKQYLLILITLVTFGLTSGADQAGAVTVTFPDGNVCAGCRTIMDATTVYKVYNPDTGVWKIPCKSVLRVDGVKYATPAKSSSSGQCIQKKITSRTRRTAMPKAAATIQQVQEDRRLLTLLALEQAKRLDKSQSPLSSEEKEILLHDLEQERSLYPLYATQPDYYPTSYPLASLINICVIVALLVTAFIVFFKLFGSIGKQWQLKDKIKMPRESLYLKSITLPVIGVVLVLTSLAMLLFAPDTLESLPLGNFFFLLASVLMLVFAIPLWKKINSK